MHLVVVLLEAQRSFMSNIRTYYVNAVSMDKNVVRVQYIACTATATVRNASGGTCAVGQAQNCESFAPLTAFVVALFHCGTFSPGPVIVDRFRYSCHNVDGETALSGWLLLQSVDNLFLSCFELREYCREVFCSTCFRNT